MNKHRRGIPILLYLVVVAAVVVSYGYWALARPLPQLSPVMTANNAIVSASSKSTLVWPAGGQAAAGIVGTPIAESHGPQKPVPIASAAKLITALTVLRDKPLKPGEQGPTISLDASDVALYDQYVARHGSVVPVASGEKISQYQMLQAIMLPSANNMADSLAIWAYGSLSAYAKTANSYIAQLGLSGTHIGTDASGLAPSTTSTARDLVELGKIAMQNPVLADIVGQSTASGVPVAGTIKNVNFLLGSDNIIGIKTGNTDEAGGVFVGASRIIVNHQPVTIVSAVAGQPSLFAAMKTSQTLIRSAQTNFKPVIIVSAGTEVGSYRQPWGSRLAAVAGKDFSTTAWLGSPAVIAIQLQPVPAGAKTGQVAGRLLLPSSALYREQSIPVQLKTAPSTPSIGWRLLHPL